jgi:hypothetical protein
MMVFLFALLGSCASMNEFVANEEECLNTFAKTDLIDQ